MGPAGASNGIIGFRRGGGIVTNTVAETSLLASTVPLVATAAGWALRATLWGRYLNTSGTNRTVSVLLKLGSSTITSFIPTGVQPIASNASERIWQAVVTVSITDAGDLDTLVAATAIGPTAATNIVPGTSTVALQSGGTLDVCAIHSAALTTVEVELKGALFELIPPRS